MNDQTNTIAKPTAQEEAQQERMDGSSAHIKQPFIDIKFQLGPVKHYGVNGTQIEEVLEVVRTRILGFQKGDFRCRENAVALTKIDETIMWLQERTRRRTKQGVEGHNLTHNED